QPDETSYSKQARPTGKKFIAALQPGKAPDRIKRRLAEAAGKKVAEPGQHARVKHGPAGGPVRFLPPEEKARGVALRGVVVARARQDLREADRISPRDRLMVDEFIRRITATTDVR